MAAASSRSHLHVLRRTTAAVCAVALVLAACGGGDEPDDGATATAVPTGTSSEPVATDEPSTVEPTDATTADGTDEPTDDATGTADDGGLPGEPWEGFAQAGDVLMVIGVRHDDVLNVRAEPGMGSEVVATAAPTADDLVATGNGRQLPTSFWYEVTVDGVTGWASARYLAFQGPVDDVTSTYLAYNAYRGVETMLELGTLVAESFASVDPPSVIVTSVAPSVGDLGEIVMDVVGIGDDSVRGFRLHIFATPDDGGEGFTLRTVERWTFCDRGVTPDTGICV